MDLAILAVGNGDGYRKEAKTYGVNYSTLRNRFKGLHAVKLGGKPKFSSEEVNWIVSLLKDRACL